MLDSVHVCWNKLLQAVCASKRVILEDGVFAGPVTLELEAAKWQAKVWQRNREFFYQAVKQLT